MPASNGHDPWDSLAESLGAAPAPETEAKPPVVQSSPPPRPAPRQTSSQQQANDWEALAADLGVESSAEQPGLPPPAAGQRRRETDARRGRSRVESPRDRELEATGDDRSSGPASAESREPRRTHRQVERTSQDRGDDREPEAAGRGEQADEEGLSRRRGRRGGRGRRRGGRSDSQPNRGERDPSSRTEETGLRADEDRLPDVREDEPAGWRGSPEDGDHGARLSSLAAEDESHPLTGSDARRMEGGGDGDDEGERPRKRRRRGRRGGRGRSRTAGESGGERPADDRETVARRTDDDEPLPASYGSRPAARTDAPRSGERRPSGRVEESQDDAGRRRRRRRSGRESNARGTASERREPAARSRSGERRRAADSGSGRDRGPRADFSPVAGRYEEDDEGLEFLGVEEAVREGEIRSSRAEDDEVLEESGLGTVLDVPSWVEAIGIVIAGNLAGRTKSGRGDRGR